MDIGFGDALLIVGLLLAVSSALSGGMYGTVLSISVLSVSLGITLALADIVSVDIDDRAIVQLVELALILTLFSDGLAVERELLTVHWSPPVRALALAMPLTLGLLALCAHLVFAELSWSEAFLLAAVLSPTDPVVTSTVVTAQRVPSTVRHVLNLESGLNDGLALPFVLFFLVLAEPGGDAGREGAKLLGEAGFGAGIVMGLAEHEIPDAFVEFAENVSAISQVLTLFVFGTLIVATSYDGEIWRLALFIALALLVARPLAILASFVRSRLPGPQKAFIAWFGPKGVASMLFALFVLKSTVEQGELIFDIAAFTILCSIVAHGLTDTVGASWIERQMRKREKPEEPGPQEEVPGQM